MKSLSDFAIRAGVIVLSSLILAGCESKPSVTEEAANPPVASNPQDNDRAQPDTDPEVVIANDEAAAYPETAAVSRLLAQANQAMSAGQFEEALGFAEQALQQDPSSVQAQSLKQRLTDILVRS